MHICAKTWEIITSNWLPIYFRNRLYRAQTQILPEPPEENNKTGCDDRCVYEMLTAIIIVARVQPGTSKGITDLLLPQPSSGLRK